MSATDDDKITAFKKADKLMLVKKKTDYLTNKT